MYHFTRMRQLNDICYRGYTSWSLVPESEPWDLVWVSLEAKLRHSTCGMWAKQTDSRLRTWNQLRTRNGVLTKCIWEWRYKWNQNQLEAGPRTRQYPNRNWDISLSFVFRSHGTLHDILQQTYGPKSIVNWLLQGEAGKNWPTYSDVECVLVWKQVGEWQWCHAM